MGSATFYKVNVNKDKEFTETMKNTGIKFMPNSVLKNCICGYNYYWVQGYFYGLLLDPSAYRYEVIDF